MENPDDVRGAASGFNLAEVQRIAGLLWRGRLVIVVVTVLTTFLSIFYLHVASYTYSTTMTLIPTQSQGHDMGGQIGGLAALAGINLSGGAESISPFSIYPETAHTRQVAIDMTRDWPDLMPRLFSDQWDAKAKTWRAPRSFRSSLVNFVKSILGIPIYAWTPPGPAELQQYIAQRVGMLPDKKKAMLTVQMQDVDPTFSRKFLLILHKATDRVARRMSLDRAKKYSAYLANELTKSQPSAVRDVLTQSLSEQETLLMMGNSDTDFAAQPLGPPESSPRPTSPTPLLVLVGGFFLGVFVGGFLVVFGTPFLESAGSFMTQSSRLDTSSLKKNRDLIN